MVARGANVVNIHHANAINPWINYPFLRPAEFAQDATTDLPVFEHALRWLAGPMRDGLEAALHEAADPPGDIYNSGAALSEEALTAFLAEVRDLLSPLVQLVDRMEFARMLSGERRLVAVSRELDLAREIDVALPAAAATFRSLRGLAPDRERLLEYEFGSATADEGPPLEGPDGTLGL